MIEEMRIALNELTRLTIRCPGKRKKEKGKDTQELCAVEITFNLTQKIDRTDWTGCKCPGCGCAVDKEGLEKIQELFSYLQPRGARVFFTVEKQRDSHGEGNELGSGENKD